MLINFAYEGLLNIKSDCINFEDHHVKNLISFNLAKRRKGFLSDRFIKPPVNISLSFKCDIVINKIVLRPRVGSQKSSGFTILKAHRNKLVEVAQALIQETTERVVFTRCDLDNEGEVVRFSSENAMKHVREMTLRIFKTSGSTVPALGSLEVWGVPSHYVPNRIKEEINLIWSRVSCNTIGNVHESLSTEKSDVELIPKPSSPEDSQQILGELEIPAEFIDPISCQIMTIPMTLPSGNIVDFSTLEKFHEAEAKHGRGQSDPFTGVLFTENRKPIVASSLKLRLDSFLLKNSNAPYIKTLPRTLGRKVGISHEPLLTKPIVTSSAPACSSTSSSSRTIDQLVLDCLDGLPSYLEAPVPISKKPRTSCVKCDGFSTSSNSNKSYSFRLPCQHIVCRECLCQLKKNVEPSCPECLERFVFQNVNRFYE